MFLNHLQIYNGTVFPSEQNEDMRLGDGFSPAAPRSMTGNLEFLSGRSGTGAGFPMLIDILRLLHTHLSLSHGVFDSPDQTVQFPSHSRSVSWRHNLRHSTWLVTE
jgi:hypothetical protein